MPENMELLHVLDQIEKDKKISKDEILSVIENALVSAYKKQVGKNVNVEAKVNLETGEMTANVLKTAVSEVANPLLEISLNEAKKIDAGAKEGVEIKIPLNPQDFSRIAAQTAKQVIVQKIRKSEKDSLYDEIKEKVGQVISGTVYRIANRNVIVDIGNTEAVLPANEQTARESFTVGQRIRTIILSVDRGIKGPITVLSRSNPELVKKLFELEVPEIYEKVVEIKAIVREAGMRTKIAVISHNPKVDPVGACVGVKGARIKPIIDELHGERIDLIPYSEDAVKYITSAFAIAKVLEVNAISQEERKAEVIVPDDTLSLAIGKGGHNVRLTARLTGWHIDVKSESKKKEEASVAANQNGTEENNQNEPMTNKDSEPLSFMQGITPKIKNTLVQAGLTDIERLKALSIDDLVILPGIGIKTAEKILESIKNI